MMYFDITDETFERVDYLICEYARISGHTNVEVAHALLSSKTLRECGYEHTQKGHLTEKQGKAAIQVLDYWIRRASEQQQQL